MRDAWGILFVNVPFLIGAMIIVIIGAVIASIGEKSTLKTFISMLLATIGGLAVLQAIYLDGFRWLNAVLSVGLVIWMGYGLVRNAPGRVTTGIGVIVMILATLTLSETYPFDQFNTDNEIGESFQTGFEQMLDILDGGEDKPLRPKRDE